jgi:hypothetical protein
MQPGSGQHQQPAKVVPVHKMPGGPQDVRPKDPAIGHSLFDVRRGGPCRALRQRPARIREFLGLDSQQALQRGFG